MASPTEGMNWILLGSTIVRKEDIRRVDVNTQFGIIYNVYLAHGPAIRIQRDDFGAEWLHQQYIAAREAASVLQGDTGATGSDTE